MTDQTAIFVALIAAAAGIIGALVGSWIAARETKRAGAMAHIEAQADRDEARRARFADRVSGLAVEVLQAAAADAHGVRLQWDKLERGSSEPLPPRSTFTTHRQATRLRMLLAESDTRIALDELEAATAGMEDSAGSPDRPSDVIVVKPTDADRARWDAVEDRFERAYRGFEDAIRIELGSEAIGAHPPRRPNPAAAPRPGTRSRAGSPGAAEAGYASAMTPSEIRNPARRCCDGSNVPWPPGASPGNQRIHSSLKMSNSVGSRSDQLAHTTLSSELPGLLEPRLEVLQALSRLELDVRR